MGAGTVVRQREIERFRGNEERGGGARDNMMGTSVSAVIP